MSAGSLTTIFCLEGVKSIEGNEGLARDVTAGKSPVIVQSIAAGGFALSIAS